MSSNFEPMGLAKHQQKDYAGAIAAFDQAIAAEPHRAQLYYLRGLAAYDAGQIYAAVSDYTQALAKDDRLAAAYQARALARLTLQNLPGARTDAEAALRCDRTLAAAHELLGVISRKQGDRLGAIASFKQAAHLFLDQRQAEDARRCMTKADALQTKAPVPINPAPAQAVQPTRRLMTEQSYFEQLIEQAQHGDVHQAIADINWLLQTDPQNGRAYCCRGVLHHRQHQYRAAVSDYNLALQYQFEDVLVYRNRARARLELADPQGAVSDMNMAMICEPDCAENYAVRGQAFYTLGNRWGAIEDLSQAIILEPENGHFYWLRGQFYRQMKEPERAIADFQQANQFFCEQEDWEHQQDVQAALKQLRA